MPSDAELRIDVYDKNERCLSPSFPFDLRVRYLTPFLLFDLLYAVDDHVGGFTTWISDGAQVQALKDMTGAEKGAFGLHVSSRTFPFGAYFPLALSFVKYYRLHLNLHIIRIFLNIRSTDQYDILDISALPQV